MPSYRLLRRRRAAFPAGEAFSATGDGEAVVRALDLAGGDEAELWLGERLVIHIPPDMDRAERR